MGPCVIHFHYYYIGHVKRNQGPTFLMLYILVSMPLPLSLRIVSFSANFCWLGTIARDIFNLLRSKSFQENNISLTSLLSVFLLPRVTGDVFDPVV